MLREHLKQRVSLLKEEGLYRQRALLDSSTGVEVQIDGTLYLSFSSNDYLGLANHPELISAVQQHVAQYGVGAGSSHLVGGHHREHHLLEEELAAWLGLPRALFFSTGYMANIGVINALVGRNDVLFIDKLNHASLNDAAVLSRAKLSRYQHADYDQLEEQLRTETQARYKFIVSDTVFSMDGDIIDIPKLLALCEQYDAYLILDDAHGLGVLGPEGQGCLAHFQLDLTDEKILNRLIYIGTLGKAAGVFGAFVAGASEWIEYFIQRARTYIYTTATPSALAAALRKSIHLMRTETWRRSHLYQLIARLKKGLHRLENGYFLLPSETAVQALIVGGNHAALTLSAHLKKHHLWVPAIRPPTVPKGQARLRISLSAAHRFEDIDRLTQFIRQFHL